MKHAKTKLRNILLFAFIIIAHMDIYGQQTNNKTVSFIIEGKMPDILDNAIIWLGMLEPYEYKGMAFKGEVKKGEFVISGQTFQNTIGLLSLFLIGSDGKPLKTFPEVPKLEFIVCPGLSKLLITDSFTVIKTDCGCKDEQKKLEQLNKQLNPYEKGIETKYKEQFKAMRTGDTILYKSASDGIKLLNDKIKPIIKKSILDNRNSFLSIVLLKNYSVDLFNSKEVEMLFGKVKRTIRDSYMGIEIERQIENDQTPATSLVGKKMMDFTAEDSLAQKIKLSTYSGKWILLDFWSSSCGPCRVAHPALKELYQRFTNEKFEIISVSIDKYRKNWLKAIADDKLTWPQLIDNIDEEKPEWYGIAFQLYKGRSIPLNFLISPHQTIEKVNISLDELEEKLRVIYLNK